MNVASYIQDAAQELGIVPGEKIVLNAPQAGKLIAYIVARLHPHGGNELASDVKFPEEEEVWEDAFIDLMHLYQEKIDNIPASVAKALVGTPSVNTGLSEYEIHEFTREVKERMDDIHATDIGHGMFESHEAWSLAQMALEDVKLKIELTPGLVSKTVREIIKSMNLPEPYSIK